MTSTAAQQDVNGKTIEVGQSARIGSGKTAWTVRWLRPDLGQVGMTAEGGKGYGIQNRYIEPNRIRIVE